MQRGNSGKAATTMCVECVKPHDAESVYDFLNDGGYSCELHVFARSAYIWDADSDDGWRRIPVAVARELITQQRVAVWHDRVYRPAWWVEAWRKQYPDESVEGGVG